MSAKFSVGQHVNHPACPSGTFSAGVGTVTEVVKSGDTFTYKVRCDKTNNMLPVDFKESDLSAA